jgi:proliferating cell nuclear antigen
VGIHIVREFDINYRRMKFKTIQASAIKSAFEVLKDILNDVNVYFTKKGVQVLTLDTARVALVDMFLDADNFEEYYCEADMVAGINVTNMFKLLKFISNNDTLTVEINSREYLDIRIENTVKRSDTRFKLKLLDINEDQIEVPTIKMAVVTTMQSIDFQRICRDMNNLAVDLEITRNSTQFIIKCEGDFANQETIIECIDDGSFDGELQGRYSLKYLNLFTKATGMCASVQIMQEEDNRFLVLRYNVANLGELKFYLATKASDD